MDKVVITYEEIVNELLSMRPQLVELATERLKCRKLEVIIRSFHDLENQPEQDQESLKEKDSPSTDIA